MESRARCYAQLTIKRLRNHDLLTSLDVLTTGSYLRLPTCIKVVVDIFDQTHADPSRQKLGVPPIPLTDEEVNKTFIDMEEAIRHRLRLSEIIPVEMSDYRIGEAGRNSIHLNSTQIHFISENGRVHFTVRNLFQTSVSVRGSTRDDTWFMVDVEFLINIGGDLTGLQGHSVPHYCILEF